MKDFWKKEWDKFVQAQKDSSFVTEEQSEKIAKNLIRGTGVVLFLVGIILMAIGFWISSVLFGF